MRNSDKASQDTDIPVKLMKKNAEFLRIIFAYFLISNYLIYRDEGEPSMDKMRVKWWLMFFSIDFGDTFRSTC